MQETKQQRYFKTEKGKESHRRATKKWIENNPEKFKESLANYRQSEKYKERKREQNRRYREKMKQKITQIEK